MTITSYKTSNNYCNSHNQNQQLHKANAHCTMTTSRIRRHQIQRFQIAVAVAVVLRQLEMTTEHFPFD